MHAGGATVSDLVLAAMAVKVAKGAISARAVGKLVNVARRLDPTTATYGRPAWWAHVTGSARNLVAICDLRGVSMRRMARELDVPHPCLRRWLRGESGPREQQRIELALRRSNIVPRGGEP